MADKNVPIYDADGKLLEDYDLTKGHIIYVLDWNEEAKDYLPTSGIYYFYTPEQMEQMAKEAQMKSAVAAAFLSMPDMTDDKILAHALIFPDWTVGNSYNIGDVVRYEGVLYQALQASTGQVQYPPSGFVAGWKQIAEPGPGGIPQWSQPLGATDAYKLGAKVTHNGKTWVSNVDNNVWEPGVYGWDEVK